MIGPAMSVSRTVPSWKLALAEAVRDPRELLSALGLGERFLPGARLAAERFPLLVPRSFIERMRPGDPNDPLLRQVLPLDLEEASVEGFEPDPLGETAAMQTPGLLRKYAGRALLIANGACAIHCRYCFRRHFPYGEAPKDVRQWEPALEEIRGDTSLREVILSGGDPLVLADALLFRLVEELEAIPHLERLRIHTRLPIVLPERVTEDLLDGLKRTRLTPVVVVHANHAAELVEHCAAALEHIVDAGIPVLAQFVLLRGVNDDADVLTELCTRCAKLRVLPYYLHQLDPVAGAAHFHVPEARGRELVAELRRRLPGYAVPSYVREVPGEASKVPL